MKLKYDFAIQSVADMYMAVAINDGSEDTNCIIRMNETSKEMFELLQQGNDEKSIINALLSVYDVEEDIIRTEVHNFILDLKNKGILV